MIRRVQYNPTSESLGLEVGSGPPLYNEGVGLADLRNLSGFKFYDTISDQSEVISIRETGGCGCKRNPPTNTWYLQEECGRGWWPYGL